MTRNEKLIWNATKLGGLVGLLINGLEQWSQINDDPTKRFSIKELIGSGIKGATIGSGVGLLAVGLGAIFEPNELDEEDFQEVEYLDSVLDSFQPDEIDQLTIKKGFSIKKRLAQFFGNDILGRPKFQGSMQQGTSLSGISDLDILVQFKRTSFKTLEQMYDTTLDYFENVFTDIGLIEIRPQKKSIGLIYDINGEQVCIDVVPARRINFDKGGHEYHLYDNPNGWFGKASRVKINPYKQADFGTDETAKANVTMLLKVLKVNEGYSLKSVMIKELTKKAFGSFQNEVPKKISDQVLETMKYIRDNIEYQKVVSPDNMNNVLSNLMTKNEKRKIANSLDYIISDIESNPKRFSNYFPRKEHL